MISAEERANRIPIRSSSCPSETERLKVYAEIADAIRSAEEAARKQAPDATKE